MKTPIFCSVMVGLLVMAVACGEGEEGAVRKPAASPSTAPTPKASTSSTLSHRDTPPPSLHTETGGFDGFRAFAAQIEAALAAKEPQFFIDRAKIIEMSCTGDEQLGPCSEKSAGTVLRGIAGAAWQSDASAIFSVEEYTTVLERYFSAGQRDARDQYGGGALAPYAVAQKAANLEKSFVPSLHP